MRIRQQRQKYSFIVFAVILMLAFLGVVLVINRYNQARVQRVLTQDYKNRVTDTATNTGTSLKNEVFTLEEKLRIAARLPAVQSLDPKVCTPELDVLAQQYGSRLGNLGRIGPDGKFYCSLNKSLIGVRGDTLGSYVSDIFNDPEHKSVISRMVNPPGSSEHLLAVHVGVTGKNGTFAGTLGGGLSVETISNEYLKDAKPSANGFYVMFDDNGDIMHHPNSELVGKSVFGPELATQLEGNSDFFDEARAATSGAISSVEYRAFNSDRFATFVPIEISPSRRIVIAAVIPKSDIQQLNNDLKIFQSIVAVILFIGSLLAVVTGVLIFYLNRNVFNPLEAFAAAATEISAGNMNRHVPIRGGREMRTLAKVLNEMVAKLKDFSSDLQEEVVTKTAELDNRYEEAKKQNKRLDDTKKAVLNILEDLNEQKSKVEADRLKDEAILSSIGDGVFAVDVYGKISMINSAALKILGLERKDAIGKWLPDVVKAQDKKGNAIDNYDRPVTQIFITGEPISTKFNYIHKDGSLVPVSLTVSPVMLNDDPIGAIEVFRDITEEIQLENAKDEFVAISSHQLRTPATAVKQFLGIMLEGYAGDITPEQKDMLESAFESNERQLRIVNDLLEVASLDSGRLAVNKQSVNISELCRSVLTEQKPVIDGRGQKVSVNMPKVAVKHQVDPTLFRMILENLVSNASKYSPEGKSLSINLTNKGSGFTVAISDTGVGIGKDDLPRLFGKFSRINNSLSTKVGGSGLGLYLVKQLVALHGGTIDVTSEINKGTTFTVTIP